MSEVPNEYLRALQKWYLCINTDDFRDALDFIAAMDLPEPEKRPTEAAVTAWCEVHGWRTSSAFIRADTAARILALAAAMPGGVPDEWLESND